MVTIVTISRQDATFCVKSGMYSIGGFVMLSDLYHLRTAATLTQRQLAELSSISKATVNKIENGSSVPRIDTVCRLATALDMKPEELFVKLVEGMGF